MHIRFFPRQTIAVSLVLLSVACCGCNRYNGPPLGRVRGTVTLDGRPLADATVVFTPVAGGRQSMDTTDQDGRFELVYLRDIRGAIVGSHCVRITMATEDSPKELLPACYNAQTGLRAEVHAGNNRGVDFALNSQG